MNGEVRWATRTVVLLGVVVALLGGGFAGPAMAGPSSREEVYQTLGVDEVAAEYVVLIDTSASMQQGADRYRAVRDGLRGFLAALSANDTVALVTFDEIASVRFHGPAGRNPDQLLARLPPRADGTHTDIGRAVETAVRLVGRSTAPVATIVMFTDGAHDPAPNSPYPFAEGASWTALARTAATFKQEQVLAYGFPLRGDAGVQSLRTVLPDARTLPVSSIGVLARELEVPKQAIRAAKARTLVGPDTARGVVVQWPTDVDRLGSGTNRVDLSVRSTTRQVPLVLKDLELTVDDPQVRIRVSGDPLPLAPGQERSVPVEIRWDPGGRGVMPLDRRDFTALVTARASVDSPWTEVLRRDLGIAFEPGVEAAPQQIGGTAERGDPVPWLLALALLGIIVVAVVLGRRHADRPRLFGTLRATSLVDGHTIGELRLAGRQMTISPETLNVEGSGSVSGSATPTGTVLRVGYHPSADPSRLTWADCLPDHPVIINGVRFEWSVGESDRRLTPAGGPGRGRGLRPRGAAADDVSTTAARLPGSPRQARNRLHRSSPLPSQEHRKQRP
ncbi:vWA domain-containing protein [Micromonospora wenchangensis]